MSEAGAAQDIAGFLLHRAAVPGGAHAQPALHPVVEAAIRSSDWPVLRPPDLESIGTSPDRNTV